MSPRSPAPAGAAGRAPGRRSAGPVRRVLGAVLVLNLLVAAAKLLVGWLVRSLSMMADGFHSLTDTASNVVGLVGISIAAQPPDREHPYGHERFETLAALMIGGLLAVTAWQVLESCIERLTSTETPQPTPLAYAVMGLTVAINLGVTLWERRRGRALQSAVLLADAEHTASDLYASLMVIVSLVAAALGWPQLDLVAALLITVMIGRAAFRILRDNGLLLADTALVPAPRIREVAVGVPGVVSVHKIRSRGRPGAGHADLHVQVRGDLPLEEAHGLGHRVADRLREEFDFEEVLVHVEPAEEEA